MRDLKYLGRYLRPYRWDLFLSIFLVFVESAFEMIIPVLMSRLVDVGIETGDLGLILAQGGKMLLCAALALITGLLYARYAARASYGFGAELRQAQYRQIQRFAFENLDRFSAPSLVTRLTADATVLQNAVISGLRPLVRSPVMLVFGVGLSFFLNAKLAMIFVLTAPALGLILFWIVHKVSPLYARQQVAIDHVNGQVQESLTAIRAIKAFVRGDYEAERFDEVNTALRDTSLKTFGYAVRNQPAFQAVMYLAIVSIMWFGGRYIAAGTMTVGELTGFLTYVLQVMNSQMMISNVFLLLTRSLASAHRIHEVLEEQPALHAPDAPRRTVPDGSVVFEDVSFRYHADAKEDALSHVSLTIRPGQTIGILGGTGSAKTTLVQLIPRLYDASEGRVLVGGHDVREYDLAALRDAVGIVLQVNTLFSGSIRENLRWGNPSADDTVLWRACEQACADAFIRSKPGGLDAQLGQGGAGVSGGQKQRLCIARALLKNPKILILDDSTSAVDTATEANIRAALSALTNVTKIVIAQRVTSVMGADQIVILDDGKIHAIGTHAQLLAQDPIYQEIYESQMKGDGEHGEALYRKTAR